jgi:hypothetical protein
MDIAGKLHVNYQTLVIGTVKTVGNWIDTCEWTRKSVAIQSQGAATLTDGVIEWSPDYTTFVGAGMIGTLDGTTYANLGSALMLKSTYDGYGALRYLRFAGAVASGSLATIRIMWAP